MCISQVFEAITEIPEINNLKEGRFIGLVSEASAAWPHCCGPMERQNIMADVAEQSRSPPGE